MEEEVNQRVVSMMVQTSRMSAGVLARGMQKILSDEDQGLPVDHMYTAFMHSHIPYLQYPELV